MSWPTIGFWLICAAFVACGIWSVIRQSQRRPEDDYSNLSDAQ